MVETKLIKERAAVKKRKPTYKRVQSNQFAKFRDTKWRKPKGMGNKDRRNRKGHVGMLKIGYGSPAKVRGLDKNGLREVLVYNITDLTKVDVKTDIAVIAATVGGKKRVDILTEAKAKKILVSKVKDFDSAIKALSKVKTETEVKVKKKTEVKVKKETVKKSDVKEEKTESKEEKTEVKKVVKESTLDKLEKETKAVAKKATVKVAEK